MGKSRSFGFLKKTLNMLKMGESWSFWGPNLTLLKFSLYFSQGFSDIIPYDRH